VQKYVIGGGLRTLTIRDQNSAAAPSQAHQVYRAGDLRVAAGVNHGDLISDHTGLELADIYRLSPDAAPVMLSWAFGDGTPMCVAHSSKAGRPGARLYLDCCATFIDEDANTVDVIVLIETQEGMITEIYVLPLAPMQALSDYTLVRIDTDDTSIAARFAQIASASFTRGTHITMADGRLRPIETLNIGNRVLTRDNGPQTVRWIGQQTVRAVGAFAPILIAKGTMGNENDLTVGPNHRLFIYQRDDAIGVGRSELTVQARLLVNGQSVVQSPGGHVDYFQLLFDHHEIIYAEGIAAESLFLDPRIKPTLPHAIHASLTSRSRHIDTAAQFEISDDTLEKKTAAAVLRRAALGPI